MNSINIPPCTVSACLFDKTPTPFILFFEALILSLTIIMLISIVKLQKKALSKYFTIFVGVLIFELFTAPMWNTVKMGPWAYIYLDVSWILTLGWTSLIFNITYLVDHFYKKQSQVKRFAVYLLALTPAVILFESAAVQLGIRTYAPEVINVINNNYIPFLNVPWDMFYYVPVFMTLVISFYKYWDLVIQNKLLIPINKSKWVRNFLIALIGVIMFEVMIEPMAINRNLPSWSYIYHDVSIYLSMLWVFVIAIAINVVDTLLIQANQQQKFASYLVLGTVLATPVEVWLIKNGFRVYGFSTTENFSGIQASLLNVPIEILFAIPFYLTLVICFIKFWEIVFDNNL